MDGGPRTRAKARAGKFLPDARDEPRGTAQAAHGSPAGAVCPVGEVVELVLVVSSVGWTPRTLPAAVAGVRLGSRPRALASRVDETVIAGVPARLASAPTPAAAARSLSASDMVIGISFRRTGPSGYTLWATALQKPAEWVFGFRHRIMLFADSSRGPLRSGGFVRDQPRGKAAPAAVRTSKAVGRSSGLAGRHRVRTTPETTTASAPSWRASSSGRCSFWWRSTALA